MSNPKILRQLLEERPVSLVQWVAEPMTGELAGQTLPGVQQRLSERLARGEVAFSLRLAELILRYWGGQDIEGGHKNLFVSLPEGRERAMLELSVGQLYIARKLERAWEHLDGGFALAAHLLEAEDYFTVLKRHELLRILPLGRVPAEASSLAGLLDEARVITRIQGGGTQSRNAGPKHTDTVD